MKKEKLRKERNKGITLIALVITIIVLLILAAVTIATLTGDNGILTKANEATQKDNQSKAEEEVKLAIGNLQIEERQRTIGQDEKISILEKELKNLYTEQQPATTISASEEGLLISHRGNRFKIDNKYNVSYLDSFNAEEWDQTAADEDCFIWESDIKGKRGYGTVIGYTEKIDNYSKLRYPSRCTKITFSNNINYNGIDTSTSRSYTNNVISVEIPGTVTNIEYAFSSAGTTETFSKLKEVKIEEGLINIGTWTFYKNKSLESIKLPNSLKTIGSSAFHYCTNLKNIEIPNGVKEIGYSAFSGCNLSDIYVPESVVKIHGQAFNNTSWYDKQPEGLIYINNVLYGCKGELSLSSVNVREGTVYITDNAFHGHSELTTVVIPRSCTGIGEWAFGRCSNLVNVTLHDNIINVGEWAFTETPWLSNQPSGLIYIGKVLYKYKDPLSSSSEKIKIKEGTVEITTQALVSCNTTEIIIPKSVTEIGWRAFGCCKNLNKINIPEGIENVNSEMFDSCTSLTSIVIPNSVKNIYGGAFEGCTNLNDITMSSSVESIGWDAFRGCSNLKDIYYKGTKENWNDINIDTSNNELLASVTIHYNQ